MNAVTSNRPIVGPGHAGILAAGLRDSVGAGLRFWPLLAILTTFWVYVALSNVLYAATMQVSFASMSPGHFFAPWQERVLQHLFSIRLLILCVLGSMRVGWTPMWRTVPLQIAMGLLFSFLASQAMVLSGWLLGHMDGWKHTEHYGWSDFLKGPDSAMWLGTATNFELTYGFGLALVTGFGVYQRVPGCAAALSRPGAGIDIRAPGSPADATVAPYSIQPVTHHQGARSAGIRPLHNPWWCNSEICCGGC